MNDRTNSSLSLHQLLTEVDDAVRTAMSATYWVRAEILQVRHNGYWAIELSSYEDGKKAKATAMIWQSQANIVTSFESASGIKLEKGLKILARVDVAFHTEYGLRLNVREFDPAFSLGDMEARLHQIRQRLVSLGENTLNKNLATPEEFTRVAVISPREAAGLGDFRTQADALQNHGLCDFHYYPALFQSDRNEQSIIDALKQIVDKHKKLSFDAIAIIRGGGDKAGLYELNKIKIARGVCRAPVPVFVGIGHERDSTILDELANRSFSTPSLLIAHILSAVIDNARSATGDYLRVQKQTSMLLEIANRDCRGHNDRVLRFATDNLIRARDDVLRVNRSIRTGPLDFLNSARGNLDTTRASLQRNAESAIHIARNEADTTQNRLLHTASNVLHVARDQSKTLQQKIVTLSQERINTQKHSLSSIRQDMLSTTRTKLQNARHLAEKHAATIEHLNPARVLERGFSLVFSKQGDALTSVKQMKNNQEITIKMRDGNVNATTSAKSGKKENRKSDQ